MRTLIIPFLVIVITVRSLAQGSIDIDTNIQMGVAAKEHVTITNSAFSVYDGVGQTPLIFGDFATGNVGIGSGNPLNLLEIHSSVQPTLAIGKGNTETGGVSTLKFQTGTGSFFNGFFVNYYKNSTTDRLGFLDGGGVEVLTLSHGGKVGIGTTSPKGYLDIGKTLSSGQLGAVLGRLNEGNSSGEGTFLGVRGYSTQPVNGKSFAIEHAFYGNINSSINFFRGTGTTGGFLAFNTNNNTERMRIKHNGLVGIATGSPNYTLHVNGSAGKPGGGSWSNSSDRRLKKNITAVENGLELIGQLNPVQYEWINPELHGKRPWEIGFIAQEVEQHFPAWVNVHDPEGDDRVLIPEGEKVKNLTLPFGFDALVVSAIKELRSEVMSLKKENDELRTLNAELRSEMDVNDKRLESKIDQIINQKLASHSRGNESLKNSKTQK